MIAYFAELNSIANLLEVMDAVEINIPKSKLANIVKRHGAFGQRIVQVPIHSISTTPMVIPLKAVISDITYPPSDINYPLVALEAAVIAAIDQLFRIHDAALWNGTDNSLSYPTTYQYFGAIGQIQAGGNTITIAPSDNVVHGLSTAVARMMSRYSYVEPPTAIYMHPSLINVINEEVMPLKSMAEVINFNTIRTLVGDIPLIPDIELIPESGVFPTYIVNEQLIEYHWLNSPNPRIFKLTSKNQEISLVVKFGGLIVKYASYAHMEVKVARY